MCDDMPVVGLGLDYALKDYNDRLQHIHHDPFDRMLIAQALHHDLTLVTIDADLRKYPVRTIW